MAYSLYLRNKKNKYKIIDLANCFEDGMMYRTSRLRDTKLFQIEELDEFTMMFNDEYELKQYLLVKGCIGVEDLDSEISIRYTNKKEVIKVPYSLLYQRSFEDYHMHDALIEKIKYKLYIEKDYEFIKRLLNRFLTTRNKSTTLEETLSAVRLLEDSIDERCIRTTDENYDDLITRSLKIILYRYYQKNNQIYYEKDHVQYRHLHDVIAMLDYNEMREKKQVTSKPKKDNSQTSLFDTKKSTPSIVDDEEGVPPLFRQHIDPDYLIYDEEYEKDKYASIQNIIFKTKKREKDN